MYLNSMIIGIVSVGGYLVAGTIINAIGNKNLLGQYEFVGNWICEKC